MTPTSRLDAELVRRGLARSRGHARHLIESGDVLVHGVPARKPATPVTAIQPLTVREAGPTWVSRAAYKLVGALSTFGLQGLTAEGKRCLDVGAGTGGFTQVLLHHGAAHVIALDVGHGQLAPAVAQDPRVDELSGTTVRDLTAADIGGRVDLLVADLSFISLTLVVDTLAGLVTETADVVLLVKPQFEVGRVRLGRNGIVRAAADRAWAVAEVAQAAVAGGLHPIGLAPSPIEGGEGNAEFLLWLARDASRGMGWEALVSIADQLSVKGSP